LGENGKSIASATPAAPAQAMPSPNITAEKLPDIDADRACGVAIRRML